LPRFRKEDKALYASCVELRIAVRLHFDTLSLA